jgi:hypothetical protein
MNNAQQRRFEEDIQAAVFRVMRNWIDRPSSVQRCDLICALSKVALAQLQCLSSDPVAPRK